MYAQSIEPLEDLYEHVCSDLRSATLDGVQLEDGSTFHICVVGVKGDWPFLDFGVQGSSVIEL